MALEGSIEELESPSYVRLVSPQRLDVMKSDLAWLQALAEEEKRSNEAYLRWALESNRKCDAAMSPSKQEWVAMVGVVIVFYALFFWWNF